MSIIIQFTAPILNDITFSMFDYVSDYIIDVFLKFDQT